MARWADGSSCMLRRIFPTKAVHRQRDLVRDMVNGDAVYPYQRAAGTEEQFAAVLQLDVDALVPLDKHAVEISLADVIAGFVHDPDHFASVMCQRRRDGAQAI